MTFVMPVAFTVFQASSKLKSGHRCVV